jgi:hypothetical protein
MYKFGELNNMTDIKIDKLIRSKRKTIGLQIAPDASLIIRAPKAASFNEIRKVVIKHRVWIKKKQDDAIRRKNLFQPRQYFEGQEFLFLGNNYKLLIGRYNHTPLHFDNSFYLAPEYLNRGRQIFTNWYILMAKKIIEERVSYYAARYKLKFARIRISNAKKRWGSCNHKGNLNFSWRLIMAPIETIDYVVVHELAHLEIKNHSARFWNKVRFMYPGYEQQRRWLRENEYQLNL